MAESYLKNNIVLSTQLFAYALFRYLVHLNPHLDLYQLIRIGAREACIQRRELVQIVDRFKDFLSEQEKKGVLKMGTTLKHKSGEVIVAEAIRYLQMFYSKEVVLDAGQQIYVQDMRLLFFYHNRLKGYEFEHLFTRQILEPILGSRTPTGELSRVV